MLKTTRFGLLLGLLLVAALVVSNGLIMLFIGNLHHVSPELIPALGFWDTLSLMLPLYVFSLIALKD